MTRLVLHADARAVGVLHPVACLVSEVAVMRETLALEDAAAQAMRLVEQEADELLAQPTVSGFRELFERLGYPDQTPAGERVIRAFQRPGSFKHINNLVDACNLATFSSGGGLGLHDASEILDTHEDVHIYRALGDEKIVPLFKRVATAVEPGDLVYGLVGPPARLLAWLGRQDVDADDFRVAEATSSVLLVALGNEATTEDHNLEVCLRVFEFIRRTCPDSRLARLTTVPVNG